MIPPKETSGFLTQPESPERVNNCQTSSACIELGKQSC